jgi:hypothetical protein
LLSGSGNKGAIIFIDELDAVGTKRFDSELSGDREVRQLLHCIFFSHFDMMFCFLAGSAHYVGAFEPTGWLQFTGSHQGIVFFRNLMEPSRLFILPLFAGGCGNEPS